MVVAATGPAVADQAAWAQGDRPKPCKLARNPALAGIVAEKLRRRWSPQQIAGWLKLTYPDDPEMQVSHESIYRTLFVQSRGALRKELTAYLRTGRVHPTPTGVRLPDGRGGRPGHPQHLANDPPRPRTGRCPVTGKATWSSASGMSPVATLVERSTRFLMLVALPDGNHKADAVADALAAAVSDLPAPAGQVADLGPGPRDGRTTNGSPSTPASRSTSATPSHPGSAAATRTPTACCASTCPDGSTSAPSPRPTSTPSPSSSTRRPRQTLGFKTPSQALAEVLR